MSLRQSLVLGMVIGFVSVASWTGSASAGEKKEDTGALPLGKYEAIWPTLDASQRMMVDLVAADFFQNEFSPAQRERLIEARARDYRAADPATRNALRQKARQEWQAIQQSATGTVFDGLSEKQKALFRRYAIDKLGLEPETIESGLAGRNDV